MNNNHNFTETDINNIDVKSPLEHQKQQQEMKSSRLRFDKINSMTVTIYKTGEINGSIYVKTPLRSNAILNSEKCDNYCFIWSILASLHPCNNNHPNTVSNYKQRFSQLNFQGFDFSYGFKCSDVHRFNELNNLSDNVFEINFYQDQSKWRHKIIDFETFKNKSDTVNDLAIYKTIIFLLKN